MLLRSYLMNGVEAYRGPRSVLRDEEGVPSWTLRTSSGKCSRPRSPTRRGGRTGEADLGEIRETCSTASFGSCAPAPPGATCPSATPLPHLPPPLPAVGRRGRARRSPPGVGRGPEGARRPRPPRVLRRRRLRGREKGGGSVGKTKRGNGTKLMAPADASGLPLAVRA